MINFKTSSTLSITITNLSRSRYLPFFNSNLSFSPFKVSIKVELKAKILQIQKPNAKSLTSKSAIFLNIAKDFWLPTW